MMKRILLIIGVMILSVMPMAPVAAVDPDVWNRTQGETTTSAETSTSTSAESGSCDDGGTFLFMRPWYAGLDCQNGKIDSAQFNSENMGGTIQKIILVVVDDILRVIGVLAAGFLVYGGFQYAYSGGNSLKATRGQKTITAAIVGMVIALLGQVAVNTFTTVLKLEEKGVPTEITAVAAGGMNIWQVDAQDLIGVVMNFVLGIATLVSVGFIIYSGIIMMTSYGDATKTAKGRKGILYAIAGLLVSLLAFAIVNFVLGGLKTAMPQGDDTDIFELVNAIFGWILGISGFIAVAGVVLGGIQYITSTGDGSKVQKAKQTTLYSIIGLAVVLLAGGVVSFVISRVFA